MASKYQMRNIRDKNNISSLDQRFGFEHEFWIRSLVTRSGLGVQSKV